MNIVDLIIVAIVALGGWNGYRLGIFRQITRLFGAVIAYFVALWLRPYLTPVVDNMLHGVSWMPPSTGVFSLVLGNLSGAVSFTVLFLVAFLLLRYAAGLIDALFSLPVLSTVNRLAGLIAGLVISIVFVYVATLVAHYINNDRLQSELSGSAIVQWLDANHPWLHVPSQSGQNKTP
ncbi:CvpA family protein [Alicyclobacillus curvatus]|nr:CvpA family protein [Alicyclobacillus curvatus]